MGRRVFQATATVCCLFAVGCAEEPPQSAAPAPPSSAAFDPTAAGEFSGQVRWQGDVPAADMLEMRTDPPVARGKFTPNPNHPRIDPASKGIANAIVFLRGVDPRAARPWDHPPVRVEMRDLILHVLQGDSDSGVGIVRAGDDVGFVSRESTFHALEVRGAAFLSLRFVEPKIVTTRRLENKGIVDMTSAAGYYWLRAYVLVDEHPYYARTDSQGRFVLKQVPPGEFHLVAWLPNPRLERRVRDPENGLVTRLVFAPPVEIQRRVRLGSKETRREDFTIGAEAFQR